MEKKIIFVCVFIFTLVIFLDPSGLMLKLKTPMFMVVMIIWISRLLQIKRINPSLLTISYFFISFGLFGVCLGIINGGDFPFLISMMSALLFIFCSFFMYEYECEFDKSIIISTLVLLCCFFIISIIYIIPSLYGKFQNVIYYLNYDVKNTMITYRDFLGFRVPMIYFKSIILLIIPIALFSEKLEYKKNIIIMSLCLFVLFVSGTRTNMVISIVILFSIVFYKTKSKVVIGYFLMIIVPMFIYIAFYIIIMKDNGDNSTKMDDLLGYVNLLRSNNFIFYGEGFGSYFYSPAHGKNVLLTELVYFDIFRWFGIIPSIIFFLLLNIPNFIFLKHKKYNLFGCYSGYLIVMGSNPLLLSSTGMFIISFFISKSVLLKKRYNI
ncbi:hypothetical protein [Photobacterium iliopiscarium]|uniref:hypothetical protein n=1 Tax=Photobacterium iliopiscarium TaxID=56192 RepID=UPI001E5746B1|nr:hypothetical protein [Photobacterium iliopiscarium]MCD9486613.1 hypothetical protein [Photobacterium iliopiscarium]MCF2243224.1 hypothetical protein [Photobacterium iliopiscarium]